MAYELIFDSCNDLGPSYDKDNGVTIIPLAFEMEGKRYLRYQDDRELSVDQFYKNQSDKIYGKTAQVTPIDFINHSTPFLKEGKDVFICPFSSGLSGTYQSALVAKSQLEADFPDRKIVVFDGRTVAPSYSLMIEEAVRLYRQGLSMEDLEAALKEERNHIYTWFAVNDLGALVHGGRVSKVSGFFAGALNIKPVLDVDLEGKLQVVSKAHGTRKALETLSNKVKETILEDGLKKKIYVSYGLEKNLADILIESLKKNVSEDLDIVVGRISPIIGVHTGPSIIALSWIGVDQNKTK